MILRCTKKLVTVIGLPVTDPAPVPDGEDWYANLLWFDRRKCLLLTHSATLFTIFEPEVTAAGLRVTDRLVTRLIERELASDSPRQIEPAVAARRLIEDQRRGDSDGYPDRHVHEQHPPPGRVAGQQAPAISPAAPPAMLVAA